MLGIFMAQGLWIFKFQFVVVKERDFWNINEMIFVSLCTLFRLKMG